MLRPVPAEHQCLALAGWSRLPAQHALQAWKTQNMFLQWCVQNNAPFVSRIKDQVATDYFCGKHGKIRAWFVPCFEPLGGLVVTRYLHTKTRTQTDTPPKLGNHQFLSKWHLNPKNKISKGLVVFSLYNHLPFVKIWEMFQSNDSCHWHCVSVSHDPSDDRGLPVENQRLEDEIRFWGILFSRVKLLY